MFGIEKEQLKAKMKAKHTFNRPKEAKSTRGIRLRAISWANISELSPSYIDVRGLPLRIIAVASRRLLTEL